MTIKKVLVLNGTGALDEDLHANSDGNGR